MIQELNHLLTAAESQGCQVKTWLKKGTVPGSQLAAWEKAFSLTFPPEIQEYARLMGAGLDHSLLADDDDDYQAHLVPSFNVLSLDNSVVFAQHPSFAASIYSREHERFFTKKWAVPFLWNGVDFISFCQPKTGEIGVTLKRSGYRVPSEIWPKASDFFEFHALCWERGIYTIHHGKQAVVEKLDDLQDLQSAWQKKQALHIVEA